MATCLAACGSFTDDTDPYNVQEAVKDLSGEWHITNVTRNGTDITEGMDFSNFVLHLNTDGSYKIDNYLPFVVKGDGSWLVDDPYHPFHLAFKESSASDTTVVTLNYPIEDGKRKLLITLSPGCYSNSYNYTMERAE